MLENIRKFSKTIFAKILLVIIVIPFVFWGMGGVFNSGNSNNLVKINNENISTSEFMDFLNDQRISEKIIRQNLENNIIEELLAQLISKKLIELEIKDFGLEISDETLKERIIKNKNFLDDKGNFSRSKYEKFLLANSIDSYSFEERLRENEIQKILFNYISGGIKIPNFLTIQSFIEDTIGAKISYINLKNQYKSDYTEKDITEFLIDNNQSFKRDMINFSYSKITPKDIIDSNEFNELFFEKIDEFENKLFEGQTLKDLFSEFDVKIVSKENFYPYDTLNKIENEIYNNRSQKFGIIDKNEFIIFYRVSELLNTIPDLTDRSFREEVLKKMRNKKIFEINKKYFEQINSNNFSQNDFIETSQKFNSQIEKIILKSKRDNMKFTIQSVEQIFSLPEKSFTLINDENGEIYLAKIDKFTIQKFPSKKQNSEDYKNFANEKLSKSLYQIYDNYLNVKYDIKINYKTIERVKSFFN